MRSNYCRPVALLLREYTLKRTTVKQKNIDEAVAEKRAAVAAAALAAGGNDGDVEAQNPTEEDDEDDEDDDDIKVVKANSAVTQLTGPTTDGGVDEKGDVKQHDEAMEGSGVGIDREESEREIRENEGRQVEQQQAHGKGVETRTSRPSSPASSAIEVESRS